MDKSCTFHPSDSDSDSARLVIVVVSASVAVAFAVAVVRTTANNKNGLVCKKQDSGAGYGHITIPW